MDELKEEVESQRRGAEEARLGHEEASRGVEEATGQLTANEGEGGQAEEYYEVVIRLLSENAQGI